MSGTGLRYRLSTPRRPRVQLTYEVEADGLIQKRTIPFVVGVLADLLGSGGQGIKPLQDREFVEIDIDSYDARLAQFAPEVSLEVQSELIPGNTVRLRFTALADFGPIEILGQIEPLQQLLELRQKLVALRAGIDEDPKLEARMSDLLKLLPAWAMPEQTPSTDPVQVLDKYIETIDLRLSRPLSAVLHHPAFQRLEAAWRGLHYLVSESETSSKLKIKVLPMTKQELSADILRKLTQQEFASFGEPFGLLVGDYEFGPDREDVELLERLAAMAAAAHAPFITGASPAFFGVKSFSALAGANLRGNLPQSTNHPEWSAFRKTENARYIGLCLPHFLLRKPYGDEAEVEQFSFHEMADGRTADKHLWGNTAFVLAARFTEAFDKHDWCAAVQGMERGGRVERLPCAVIHSEEGRMENSSPTDLAILELNEGALAQLGFIVLLPHRAGDYAVFFTVKSAQEDSSSAQIPYLMAASRIAHFLKLIMREKAVSREGCETLLNDWLSSYVLPDDAAGSWAKPEFPLREARIEVSEIPGETGAYSAILSLRPRFQLDELTAPMQVHVHLQKA